MIDADDTGYVTVAEAAKRLHVSHPTVWRWIKAGTLPAYRVGPKNIRIREADLAAVIHPAAPRGEVSPVADVTANQTMTISPMTEEERQRGLVALKDLDELQERMAAARDGQPFSSSVDLIQEMREERSRHLDSL